MLYHMSPDLQNDQLFIIQTEMPGWLFKKTLMQICHYISYTLHCRRTKHIRYNL